MGFNIPEVDSFDSNRNKYINFLSNKKFTVNWPHSEILNYLNIPINKALVILACNDVDGVVAGCTVPTSNMIRSAIRIIGITKENLILLSIRLLITKQIKIRFTIF